MRLLNSVVVLDGYHQGLEVLVLDGYHQGLQVLVLDGCHQGLERGVQLVIPNAVIRLRGLIFHTILYGVQCSRPSVYVQYCRHLEPRSARLRISFAVLAKSTSVAKHNAFLLEAYSAPMSFNSWRGHR